MRFKDRIGEVLFYIGMMILGASLAEVMHGQELPNDKLTPGAIRTTSEAEICNPRFRTAPYRHTTPKMKAQAYANYHRKKVAGVCCEVDHRVPLELGGADVQANLWPQPYEPRPGAHEKDILENYLQRAVCKDHSMKLAQAQDILMHHSWYAALNNLIPDWNKQADHDGESDELADGSWMLTDNQGPTDLGGWPDHSWRRDSTYSDREDNAVIDPSLVTSVRLAGCAERSVRGQGFDGKSTKRKVIVCDKTQIVVAGISIFAGADKKVAFECQRSR